MLKKILLAVSVLMMCLALLEWNQRQEPPSRWQRVSDFETVDGVHVWETKDKVASQVRSAECAQSSGADIVIAGDSILYGVMLEPEITLGPTLSRTVKRADGTPACVVNVSVPGFTFESEMAVIKRDWELLHPNTVVLEVWHNSPHSLIDLGGHLFNFGNLAVDSNGVPNPMGVPPLANRELFVHSALWRRLVEGSSSRSGNSKPAWEQLAKDISDFNEWLEARDASLMLVFATRLKDPWGVGRERERTMYGSVSSWAEGAGVPILWFDQALSSKPVEEVRLDECCHLNETGMALLADALAESLNGQLSQ